MRRRSAIAYGQETTQFIYGVNDKPPIGTAVLLSLQHVFVISVSWTFVVVIVTAFGGGREQADRSSRYR